MSNKNKTKWQRPMQTTSPTSGEEVLSNAELMEHQALEIARNQSLSVMAQAQEFAASASAQVTRGLEEATNAMTSVMPGNAVGQEAESAQTTAAQVAGQDLVTPEAAMAASLRAVAAAQEETRTAIEQTRTEIEKSIQEALQAMLGVTSCLPSAGNQQPDVPGDA